MMINLDNFYISADRDGDMCLNHGMSGCGTEISLNDELSYISISRLIEIAEEHLKVCSRRVAEEG